jgi:hypothetical protein
MEQFTIGTASPIIPASLGPTNYIDEAANPYDVLEMTQSFVAVLLSGQAGPLTETQMDLLDTIRSHVAQAIEACDSVSTTLAFMS